MSRPEPLRTLPEQAFRARARLVALLLCGICFAGPVSYTHLTLPTTSRV